MHSTRPAYQRSHAARQNTTPRTPRPRRLPNGDADGNVGIPETLTPRRADTPSRGWRLAQPTRLPATAA